ncbi:ABC transporter domain-containing protein [Psidium guajava]|nr:ABC transporter domain-containing protein [Psidium guajava]
MSTDSSSSSSNVSGLGPLSASSSPVSIGPYHTMTGLHNTLVKLDGTNYPSWSMALSTFIYSNRQSRWLEKEPPKDLASLEEWKIVDATLRTLLWGSMAEFVRHLFMDCATAREVWIKCSLLYSGQNNMSRVCDMWEALFEAKIGDAGLAEYYARFASLYQRLKSYFPPATTVTQMQQREADMMTVLFLRGLGPDHTVLRQQITSQSTLPSIEEVYSRAARYTSSPKNLTLSDSSAMVARGGQGTRGRVSSRGHWSSDNSYRGRGRGLQGRGFVRGGGNNASRGARGGGRGNRFCTHCQLSGHTVDYCYDLHPEL